MKALQVVHFVVTLLILGGMIVGFLLFGCGAIEVRVPDKNPGIAPPRIAIGDGKSKFRLVVIRGLKLNTEYPIWDGRDFIGRADELPVDIDLTFQEPEDQIWTSRQHAVITCKNGSLSIEDLKSSNGTYVNRRRVPPGQQQPLKVDDVVQIGTVHLKVQ